MAAILTLKNVRASRTYRADRPCWTGAIPGQTCRTAAGGRLLSEATLLMQTPCRRTAVATQLVLTLLNDAWRTVSSRPSSIGPDEIATRSHAFSNWPKLTKIFPTTNFPTPRRLPLNRDFVPTVYNYNLLTSVAPRSGYSARRPITCPGHYRGLNVLHYRDRSGRCVGMWCDRARRR